MRTIKFRAYNKFLKQMFSVEYLSDWYVWGNDADFSGKNRMENTAHDYSPKDGNTIVMQFTGLKDIKYKEVFEGDIVKVTGCDFYSNDSFSTEPEDKDEWEYVGVVEQNSFMWLVSGDKGKTWIPLCDTLSEDIEVEVIGSIYENPELLK